MQSIRVKGRVQLMRVMCANSVYLKFTIGTCGQYFADTKICAGRDRRDSSLEPTLVTTAQVSQD